MTDHDEIAATQLMYEIYFDKGWSRVLPPASIEIIQALVADGPQTWDELDAWLRQFTQSEAGLESFAWDPLHEYTDESLAQSRADFPEFADEDEDEPETAAEVNANEAERREKQLESHTRYLTSLGLEASLTVESALDLMAACHVLNIDQAGAYSMNPDAPLPGEVLQLGAEEQELQDKLRWDRMHERLAQKIIGLFNPDAQLVTVLQPTLRHLASELDCDPESARHAVASLTDSSDFSASADVLTLDIDQPFDLTVDWPAFNSNRIGIRYADPSSDE